MGHYQFEDAEDNNNKDCLKVLKFISPRIMLINKIFFTPKWAYPFQAIFTIIMFSLIYIIILDELILNDWVFNYFTVSTTYYMDIVGRYMILLMTLLMIFILWGIIKIKSFMYAIKYISLLDSICKGIASRRTLPILKYFENIKHNDLSKFNKFDRIGIDIHILRVLLE